MSAAFAFADIGESEFVPWAWCEARAEGPLPQGVSDGGDGKLLIWRRDASGAACFDFAETADWTIADGTIHFYGGRTTKVASLVVPAGAADELTFVGEEGAVLEAAGGDSVFMVEATAGQVRCWKGLEFRGNPEVFKGELYQDGGAIQMYGGRLEVVECAFVGCLANELGGAIAAIGLTADSVVSNATFVGNCCNEYNGYGGAVYASAAAEGVTLTAAGCVFDGNWAANGGAIATVVAASAARVVHERPAGLKVSKSEFIGNEAVFGGGAVSAEGDVAIDASATLFRENVSGFSGGAINVMGSCREEDGEIGFEFSAPTVTIGRGVVFVDNVVSNEGVWVQGGAVAFDRPGCAFAATGVLFKGNRAVGDTSVGDVLGGALALEGVASALVDTCVFDANDAAELGVGYDAAFGGAIDFCDADGVVKNCTFRGADVEAVSVLSSTVGFTNCVIVGNGLKPGYGDVYVFNSAVGMSYSAYGTVSIAPDDSVSTLTGGNNLTGCVPDKVYAGETLRLNEDGFNPVAALGIVQDAFDFVGVRYGSKNVELGGSSMGAFETGFTPLVVTLTGDKAYDGHTTSNGCAWTWKLTDTNGVAQTWDELGDVGEAFTVVDWTFGKKDHGYYASTNAAPMSVDATLAGKEELRHALRFRYDGTISRRDVELGGMLVETVPDEYAYTGSEIKADVKVTDTNANEVLVLGTDYILRYENNVNPTDGALAIVEGINNYEGVVSTNYFITAYYVEYSFDGEVDDSLTEIHGAKSADVVEALPYAEKPEGYAFDKFHSPTNGTVYRYGDGTPAQLVLEVKYCTDANGDTVPDKYQKQIRAKVVNGEWNGGDNGRDKILWVTLTEDGEPDGVWSKEGKGKLPADKIPAAGENADGGYTGNKDNKWLTLQGGQLVYLTVDQLEKLDITSGSVPFFLYAYLKGSPTSSLGFDFGRPGSDAGTSETPDVAGRFAAYVEASSLTMNSAKKLATISVKATLVEAESGAPVTDIPLEGSTLKVKSMETLGGPAEDLEVPVDGDGNVTVPAEGASGFWQVGL